MNSHADIEILDLGLRDYESTLTLQHQLQERVATGRGREAMIFVQHPPVLTLGKNADPKFVLQSKEQLERQGIHIVPTDRGGEVTAHMPGQLVVYPILHLGSRHLLPKAYVNLLEEAVIQTLAHWSVKAARHEVNPGVWLGEKKIAAIGVRIKDHVSMHGLALNVARDESGLFGMIVPCGIKGYGVTYVSDEIAKPPTLAQVQDLLRENLIQLLQDRVS